MALSDEEQRLLDQMEAALVAEDPKLANTMRGNNQRRLRRRRATIAGIGFIAGLGMLVGGMEVHPAVSIVGFILMLASTVIAITAWNTSGRLGGGPNSKNLPRDPTGARADRGAHARERRAAEKNFMDRMEERWRRRQGGE